MITHAADEARRQGRAGDQGPGDQEVGRIENDVEKVKDEEYFRSLKK